MSKEWKDGFRQIVIAVAPPIVILILTALIKGEELRGLGKAAAFLHLLGVGVPLWLFLAVLVAAVLAVGRWIQTRAGQKETLQIAWQPELCHWGEGASGTTPLMQVLGSGYFTNTAKDHKLIITSIYLEGTKPVIGMREPIEIAPGTCSLVRFDAYVAPIVGADGETYEGRLILVDQFGVKHRVPIELNAVVQRKAQKAT